MGERQLYVLFSCYTYLGTLTQYCERKKFLGTTLPKGRYHHVGDVIHLQVGEISKL